MSNTLWVERAEQAGAPVYIARRGETALAHFPVEYYDPDAHLRADHFSHHAEVAARQAARDYLAKWKVVK